MIAIGWVIFGIIILFTTLVLVLLIIAAWKDEDFDDEPIDEDEFEKWVNEHLLNNYKE